MDVLKIAAVVMGPALDFCFFLILYSVMLAEEKKKAEKEN